MRDAGATARESTAVARQSTGSSLRWFLMVPERELKMTITRLAATASLISQPAASTSVGRRRIPPPPPARPPPPPPFKTPARRVHERGDEDDPATHPSHARQRPPEGAKDGQDK